MNRRSPRSWWLLIVCVFGAGGLTRAAMSQDTLNFPVLGEVIRHDADFDNAVPPDSKLHVIAAGFDWTEGPVWTPAKGDEPARLLFSDIPRNSVYQWVEGVGANLYLKPSGYTGVTDYGAEPGSNGLLLDPQGRLVSCEHGDRRVSVMIDGGGKRTLVDNYRGKRLNSPNDAVFMSNGDLYFTDPPYGLPNRWDDPRRELDFCGVYRLSTDGELTLLTDEMTRPNGIGFSPDEKTLYVAQSDPDAAIWMAFPVKNGGTLGKGRVLHDATDKVDELPGLPDGMAVAEDGHDRAGRRVRVPSGRTSAGPHQYRRADGQLHLRRRRRLHALSRGGYVCLPHPDRDTRDSPVRKPTESTSPRPQRL